MGGGLQGKNGICLVEWAGGEGFSVETESQLQ